MKRKIIRYLIIAIGFAVVGPIVIHLSYRVEDPIMITDWDAVDLLDYYGTILGSVISVLVIWITIANEHEKIAIERRDEKQRIEEQRHYDNIMGILDKVSDSIMESLLHLKPNRLYNIFYGYSVSYRNDYKWWFDLRDECDKYLDRADWLVNEYKRRIDELSCYGIDEPKLEEIYNQLLELYLAYFHACNNLMDIGLNLIETNAVGTSADFDDEYKKIADVKGDNKKIYKSISSECGKLIQNIRIQIMQKANYNLQSERTP